MRNAAARKSGIRVNAPLQVLQWPECKSPAPLAAQLGLHLTATCANCWTMLKLREYCHHINCPSDNAFPHILRICCTTSGLAATASLDDAESELRVSAYRGTRPIAHWRCVKARAASKSFALSACAASDARHAHSCLTPTQRKPADALGLLER